MYRWKGEKPNPDLYFGFIYLVTNKLTGKRYIGKKQYWKSSGRVKNRPTDRQLPTWKTHHWKESDWMTYTGSSNELNRDIKRQGVDNFTFEILSQHKCRSELHYAEVEWQVLTDCLRELDKNGLKSYYNKQISAVRFIPKDYVNNTTLGKMKRKFNERFTKCKNKN